MELINAMLELGEQPQVKILACDADVAKEVIPKPYISFFPAQ